MKTPEEVLVVIIKDRHTDIAVEVWADREAAIARAREVANAATIFLEDYHEVGVPPGWEFHVIYSIEGDSVRVMKTALQQLVKVNK